MIFRTLILIFFTFLVSCANIKPLHDNSLAIIDSNPVTENRELEPKPVIMASYKKHYKFITNDGNIRAIERIYYGPQTDILPDFAKLESKSIINKNNYTKYPIASFFSEDAIHIPDDKKEKAKEIYTPLIDTLFSSQTIDSNLYIEILILGYTDFSPVVNDSILFKEVLNLSQKKAMTVNEFYTSTSFFRTKEIASMLSKLIEKRQPEFKQFNKIIIEIIQEGKGIELPDSKREYELMDAKRRIAKVYWRRLKL